MIQTESLFLNMINNPVRDFEGRVEILEGSALLDICKCGEQLKEFTIERVGDSSKFFGFGVCQKLNVKMLDVKRERELSTANTLDVAFGVGSDFIHPYPYFYITQVRRDENTNALSITAYDALYKASNYTVADITGLTDYTIKEFANACAALLGLSMEIVNVSDNVFETHYPEGANFSGTETIRQALDAVAEATQTIYYINSENVLVFKRIYTGALYTIMKSRYIDLDVGENKRLSAISHTTELGDNVTAQATYTGTTQYIRENPFYTMREDINTLLDNALSAVGGLLIRQFDCNWRGNFLMEIGDRMWIYPKQGEALCDFYILDDVIKYDGTLSEKTRWKYEKSDTETESNLTTIGDTIRNTYARVDKVNQEIELVATAAEDNKNAIASIKLNTESINATVESVRKTTEEAFDTVNSNIGSLTSKVEAQITAEDVNISISNALDNGVTKVETETGFKFDKDGLTVSKSNSDISTLITEDGMKISKNDDVVLTANNVGVEARNLHATTYLIVGANSRFEDYNDNRTGCFWIGGE